MDDLKQSSIKKDINILLSFLKRTKDGEYAEIEKSSIPYSRIQTESSFVEIIEEDEEYYYSCR